MKNTLLFSISSLLLITTCLGQERSFEYNTWLKSNTSLQKKIESVIDPKKKLTEHDLGTFYAKLPPPPEKFSTTEFILKDDYISNVHLGKLYNAKNLITADKETRFRLNAGEIKGVTLTGKVSTNNAPLKVNTNATYKFDTNFINEISKPSDVSNLNSLFSINSKVTEVKQTTNGKMVSAGGGYLGFNLDTSFKEKISKYKKCYVLEIYDVKYSLSVESIKSIDLKDGIDQVNIKDLVSTDKYPVYISKIYYGSRFKAVYVSNLEKEEFESELASSFSKGAGSVNASYKSFKSSNSEFISEMTVSSGFNIKYDGGKYVLDNNGGSAFSYVPLSVEFKYLNIDGRINDSDKFDVNTAINHDNYILEYSSKGKNINIDNVYVNNVSKEPLFGNNSDNFKVSLEFKPIIKNKDAYSYRSPITNEKIYLHESIDDKKSLIITGDWEVFVSSEREKTKFLGVDLQKSGFLGFEITGRRVERNTNLNGMMVTEDLNVTATMTCINNSKSCATDFKNGVPRVTIINLNVNDFDGRRPKAFNDLKKIASDNFSFNSGVSNLLALYASINPEHPDVKGFYEKMNNFIPSEKDKNFKRIFIGDYNYIEITK